MKNEDDEWEFDSCHELLEKPSCDIDYWRPDPRTPAKPLKDHTCVRVTPEDWLTRFSYPDCMPICPQLRSDPATAGGGIGKQISNSARYECQPLEAT